MPIPPLAWLVAGLAVAQQPSEAWRTVRTEHFRIHYPTAAAPWSEDAASRLEAWHARVAEEVGWLPDDRIDVVIVDPYSDANGMALPFSRAPRTMLWATPPEAASVIGTYRSWAEILITHEDAHLVHLIRPSRNALEQLLTGVTGFGPITRKSPRWVVEGYATVVEGRLSGSGRPNGDGRAQLLRNLAQTGQMPSYSELSSSARWGGGGFAYLVGSAYLEWLEARTKPGALRDLWARMTARQVRSFDEAFEGVFGAPPAELYGRYVAELTADAMADGPTPGVSSGGPTPEETELLRIGWTLGGPAVSPDGKRVAVPVFPKRGLPSVDVYQLDVDADAVKKRDEAVQKLLERDPEDVPAVQTGPEPRKRDVRRRHAIFAAREVAWLPDGSGLLLSAWSRDGAGRVRPDLFRWTEDTGRTDRVTRHADLTSPDPAPDGTWAVATQLDFGQTRIVRVDLATGDVTPITSFDVSRVDGPRVSPDGERVAWLHNAGQGYAVVVRHLGSGAQWRSAPTASGDAPMSLSWTSDGRALVGSVGADGRVEVHELWRDGAVGRGRLTWTAGGAWFPDLVDDQRAVALSMSYRGFDVHEVPLAVREPVDAPEASLAHRPTPPDAPPMPDPAPIVSQRYGVGPLDLSPLVGGAFFPSGTQGQVELGVRAGDPVGRWEGLLVGAYGAPDGGTTGGRAALTWRGWPVRVGLDAYLGSDAAVGVRRAGLAAQIADGTRGPSHALSGALAAVLERPFGGDPVGPRQLVFGSGGLGWIEPRTAALGAFVGLRAAVGVTGPTAWQQVVASGRLQLLRNTPLVVSYDTGSSSGRTVLDQFSLGGQASTATVGAANTWRVWDPVYAAGAMSGPRFDTVSASFGGDTAVFVQRHRFGAELGRAGLSAVGLRTQVEVDGQAIARVAAVRAQAGVACRVEWPGQGWSRDPCLDLGDWALWAGLRWDR